MGSGLGSLSQGLGTVRQCVPGCKKSRDYLECRPDMTIFFLKTFLGKSYHFYMKTNMATF